MRKVEETKPGRIAYYDLTPEQWQAGVSKLSDGSLLVSFEATEEDTTFLKLAISSPEDPSPEQVAEFEAALGA